MNSAQRTANARGVPVADAAADAAAPRARADVVIALARARDATTERVDAGARASE
jgi:hypothetical protein